MVLKGNTAIVTGVSKGIGLAVIRDLLEKGMNVAGWGRTAPDLEHDNFLFVKVDVRSQDDVDRALSKTLERFGDEIQVLVNNAGMGYFKNMEDLSEEAWNQMFDTNVHGIFHVTRRIIPLMKARKAGHIVNIASIAALTGIAEGTAYCGTKFAVRGISHSLFKEVRRYNIKVSCIYPGSVNTEFFVNYDGVVANDTMLSPEDISRTVAQVLETPDNCAVVDVEIRPMNPKYSG